VLNFFDHDLGHCVFIAIAFRRVGGGALDLFFVVLPDGFVREGLLCEEGGGLGGGEVGRHDSN
jgi:hypothetical protein